MSRRSYGTGTLYVRRDARGRETWYGRWYSGGERIKRAIGAKRPEGSREGLTRAQAERELQRRIETERTATRSRMTIEQAGAHYLEHLEYVLERKQTTLADYRYMLGRHLIPYFAERPMERIEPAEVNRFLLAKKQEGLATKTITNHLTFLHGLFRFAIRRGWAAINPVDAIDRPRSSGTDPDIHYLTLEEVEALLAAVEPGYMAETDRTVYLVAATTGLRQGELIALRWQDVDWTARRLRVRRTYTRGQFGTPKSRRSSRSVPMTERTAAELAAHRERSAYSADGDLALPHPHTGHPLDASRLRRRFKQALSRAEVRPVRFHDLRHTFGTHCAAAGVPMRMLQEWMGHRDLKTTEIYADYAPSEHEAELVERAFVD